MAVDQAADWQAQHPRDQEAERVGPRNCGPAPTLVVLYRHQDHSEEVLGGPIADDGGDPQHGDQHPSVVKRAGSGPHWRNLQVSDHPLTDVVIRAGFTLQHEVEGSASGDELLSHREHQ